MSTGPVAGIQVTTLMSNIQVSGMGDFRGYFACPTTLLEDTRIDTHEVHTRQMDRLAIICYCPLNIKRTACDAIVRMAVSIAVIEGLLYPICAFPVGVISIIWQA